MSTGQVFDEYLAMKDGLGWVHIKDYCRPAVATSHVDEESLASFVPADEGIRGTRLYYETSSVRTPRSQQDCNHVAYRVVF